MRNNTGMPNRLAKSSSPYLLQHAENPVDWYEWSDEARALARDSDRPILLSVGYAACHWCHVMAHESFEDVATAEVMNRHFVNIKVDREQRPDLDRIYQLAHQVMQRRGGGWPLTAFLDPHTHQPFFIGTYFPRTPRHGLPPFITVLERVAHWYHEEKTSLAQHNEALAGFFSQDSGAESATSVERGPQDRTSVMATVEQTMAALERGFDPQWGGFGTAPKFPHPTQLELLLRRTDKRAHHMAQVTLERMCRGGLFDHLGGGFARYSVDERWEIPHFEKMLYDNGALLAVLGKVSGTPLFRRAATMTAGWIMREMQHPEGGYFASVDADSEGHEGRYYIWDADLARDELTPEEWSAFAPAFGLDGPPNFEEAWHLHCGNDADLTNPRIHTACQKLRTIREQRIRPGLDDKILVAWNGLAIRGMVIAGRAYGEPTWVESAFSAARFIHREHWRDGRLCTSWRNGEVLGMAFLDDYAFLLDGLVTLLECDPDQALLDFAGELAQQLVSRFGDSAGGFFFTAEDHERLIQRPKSFTDDATPNGNGVAAHALLRLAMLTGEDRYQVVVDRTLSAAAQRFGEWPHAHAACLLAMLERWDPRPPMCPAPL